MSTRANDIAWQIALALDDAASWPLVLAMSAATDVDRDGPFQLALLSEFDRHIVVTIETVDRDHPAFGDTMDVKAGLDHLRAAYARLEPWPPG